MPSYLVISPVKDEENYIEATLQSMVAQSLRPVRWVIVDDGSGDRTAEIVERYCREHDWILLIRLPRRSQRLIGSAEVIAFQAGFDQVRHESFDLVVKLDGDLRLQPSYFESLLARFELDPKLGIASGVYVERHNEVWTTVRMPEYHAAGACKVVRTDCFAQIGGFVPYRGWDTVDEIRAQTLGWRTCHFPDLQFEHLRAEGAACGSLHTNQLHGEVYYVTGGPFAFFLLKVVHRMMLGKPPVLAGMMLLAGYLRSLLLGRKRLVTEAEARHYRRAMNKRVWAAVSAATERLGLRLNVGRSV